MSDIPVSSARSLRDFLGDVPDFRSRHGLRYDLSSVLCLACAAMLCGYNSYGAMAEWSKHYGAPLAAALGFKEGKTPSVGTLHTIFSRIDKRALEKVLGEWTESLLSHPPDANETKGKEALVGVSIDGKTLCSSKKQAANESHLLSAVSHGLGLTLFQHGVDEKTNEIVAAQAVLEALILEGRVVTVDALLTQKKIAQTILDKKGTS